MTSRFGILLTLGSTILFGTFGWVMCRPLPTLDGVDRLLASGEFDRAEARITAYLDVNPGSVTGRLLLARMSVDRGEPKPELALEQLRQLRPTGDAKIEASAYVIAGKANFLLDRLAGSEKAYQRALKLNPWAEEAAWGLLNQYSLQERFEDSKRVGLELHVRAKHAHERMRFLLEIVHYDVILSEIALVSRQFYLEKAVAADPGDVASRLALGTVLVRTGRTDQGLERLREVVKLSPWSPRVWKLYFDGLLAAGEVRELAEAVERVPPAFRSCPTYLEACGRAAQERGDWESAVASYRRSWEAFPYDRDVVYRLVTALRRTGRSAAAAELEPEAKALDNAHVRLNGLYFSADTADRSGAAINAELCESFAVTLQTLGRKEESDAWWKLARREPEHAARMSADPTEGSGDPYETGDPVFAYFDP